MNTTTATENACAQYVEMLRQLQLRTHADIDVINQKWFSVADLLYRNARTFTPAPLETTIKAAPMGQCYKNASDLVLWGNGSLVYCEGYALRDGLIPLEHAWCVTRDGKVVDPTWPDDGDEYYGVPIKLDYLRESLLKRGYYGVLDDWQNDWPVLKAPVAQWLEVLP